MKGRVMAETSFLLSYHRQIEKKLKEVGATSEETAKTIEKLNVVAKKRNFIISSFLGIKIPKLLFEGSQLAKNVKHRIEILIVC